MAVVLKLSAMPSLSKPILGETNIHFLHAENAIYCIFDSWVSIIYYSSSMLPAWEPQSPANRLLAQIIHTYATVY